jgi:hypothetical protein
MAERETEAVGTSRFTGSMRECFSENIFSSKPLYFHEEAFPTSLRDGTYFLFETGDVVPG